MSDISMRNFCVDPERLLEVRRALYSENGDGYYVFKNFLSPQELAHMRNVWTNPAIRDIFKVFKSKSCFDPGCANYFSSKDSAQKKGETYFNFFWNRPVDEVTHLASFAVAFVRSAIMGQYPLQEPFGYGIQSTSYRVTNTVVAEDWTDMHRDYLKLSDNPQFAKIAFDLSRLQATLLLSNYGEDYSGDGFIFEKNNGDEVVFGRDVDAGAGDLVVWRYNNLHGIQRIQEVGDGIGFLRIIFPPEVMNSRIKPTTDAPAEEPGAESLEELETTFKEQRPFYGVKGEGLEAARTMSHEGAIPGMYFTQWDSLAKWQLNALKANGLQPHHKLLDIGSGMMRLGVAAIDYLEDGNYFGIDAYDLFVDGSRELARKLSIEKEFHLICDDDFSFEKFGVGFDFAMSQSVFTHLSREQILDCISKLKPVMNEGGKLVFTSTGGLPKTVGFLYANDIPMQRPIIELESFYRDIAESLDLEFNFLDKDHPTGQPAALLTF